MLDVKIKLLNDKAKMPFQKHVTDAGFDLFVTSGDLDMYTNIMTYRFGIALEIPEGYVGLLFPRSSVSKKELELTNSVGVIDSSYRGEIMAKFRFTDDTKNSFKDTTYSVGDRAVQLIIMPYPRVAFHRREELSNTERGEGGYGSTNK